VDLRRTTRRMFDVSIAAGAGGGRFLCACFSIYTCLKFGSRLTRYARWHRHYGTFSFVRSPLSQLTARHDTVARLVGVPIVGGVEM